MQGETLPSALHRLRADQIASDLVYEPTSTPFLVDAGRAGATVHGGLGMLVHQAALGFARWHGLPAPREAFHEAVVGGNSGE